MSQNPWLPANPLTAMGLSWVAGFSTGGLLAAVYFLLTQVRVGGKSSDLLEGKTKNKAFLDQLEKDFHVSPAKLYEIMRYFISEMERGLTVEGSSMKMIPSYVVRLPEGQEKGSALALDLGGSNFRVVQVLLEGNGQYRTQQKKFVVSNALKTGPVEDLFDFLAECIQTFLQEFNLSAEDEHNLGFTFSFPVNQTSISSGTLIGWTKEFSCPDAIDRDVVQLLADALKRKRVFVKVTALVNDTVGTLVSHAYRDIDSVVGVILGTGSNAAYIEKLESIPKWHGPNQTGKMVVNMEWGDFDSKTRKVLPLNSYDRRLDEESSKPGSQLFEKMISGMYLGEIARITLIELSAAGHIFDGQTSKQLQTKYGVDTSLLSRIERDHSSNLRDIRTVLEEIWGIYHTTTQDREVVKRVCELVGIRAARLSAAGIGGVITKANRLNGCTVAIDGSVFQHYPHFADRMSDALNELFGVAAINIQMALAQDGSGVGAGLIALLAATPV